jgi:hypothetical protein
LSGIKKLAGQTLWYGLSSIAARLINYLLTPYLTYKLSIEIYAYLHEFCLCFQNQESAISHTPTDGYLDNSWMDGSYFGTTLEWDPAEEEHCLLPDHVIFFSLSQIIKDITTMHQDKEKNKIRWLNKQNQGS